MRRLLAPALPALLAAALPGGARALAAQSPAAPRARVVAALDSVARAPVARGEVVGLTVVVRRGADTLLVRGYGHADLARAVPMTVGHVFPIASLTKQVAAAAVLRLVERGAVRLDDDVARHLHDSIVRARGIAVRQLLTHTSGLPDFADRPDPDSARPRDVRPERTLARVRGLPPDFAPGTQLRYSNTNYLLLGMLLERHAGGARSTTAATWAATPATSRTCPTTRSRSWCC